MKVFAGIMNVLCIILTVFVALAMLIMLIVTPLVCSTLDVVDPEKLTKIVTDIMTQVSEPSPSAAGPYSSSSTSDSALGDMASGDLGAELKDFILGEYGEYVTEETLNDILQSNAVQEVIGAYAEDITNALTGGTGESKFNAEAIKQIVDDNMDEIIDILQEVSPELAETDREEIKSTIQTAVDDNAEQIVEALPKPEEVKDALVEEMPELEIGLAILAQRDTIKIALWGAIAILALLVFVLRLFRISGFLWISVYMFIAVAFNGMLCFGLKLTPALAAGAPSISAIITAMLNPLFSSMLTYTLILLGVAVVCLVAHIFIQKARKAHRAKRQAAEVKLNIPEGTVLYTTCIDEDTFVGSSLVADAPVDEEKTPVEEEAPAEEEAPVEEAPVAEESVAE